MKLAALGLAAVVLGGCATAPVTVTGDSYCRISKKIRWSVEDTPETITAIRRENAKHRRVCSG
jgi:hypothetical protein